MTSSYLFVSKKAREQNWANRTQMYRKVGTERLLKGLDLRKPSRSFLFTIKGMHGIEI